jgi:type II secretory pathway pseudopilin PulG
MARTTWRQAFTIVELVVCLGVAGMVAALLLPALQMARESSRRLQCGNNLRQIAIALHGHEATHRRFPRAGYMLADGTGASELRSHAPHLYLLPHLDQQSLFANVDLRALALRDTIGKSAYDPVNLPVQEACVSLFLCPSDPSTLKDRRNNYRANIGPTAYPMDTNPHETPMTTGGEGAFYPIKRHLMAQDFRDGLSNTVAFSERLSGDGNNHRYSPAQDYFQFSAVGDINRIMNSPGGSQAFVAECGSLTNPQPPHDSSTGQYWFFGSLQDTWYNHLLTPNHQIPDCGIVYSGMWGGAVMTARSAHPAGVNCMMMDGSVRFQNDQVDPTAWRALGTRNGRDAVFIQ